MIWTLLSRTGETRTILGVAHDVYVATNEHGDTYRVACKMADGVPEPTGNCSLVSVRTGSPKDLQRQAHAAEIAVAQARDQALADLENKVRAGTATDAEVLRAMRLKMGGAL